MLSCPLYCENIVTWWHSLTRLRTAPYLVLPSVLLPYIIHVIPGCIPRASAITVSLSLFVWISVRLVLTEFVIKHVYVVGGSFQ
jgi:hypothetical protein